MALDVRRLHVRGVESLICLFAMTGLVPGICLSSAEARKPGEASRIAQPTPPYRPPHTSSTPWPAPLDFQFGMEELYRASDMSGDDVVAHLGLDSFDGCLELTDRKALVRRRERWRHALRILSYTRPERLYGWLIGVREPPAAVLTEVRHQRNCLIDAMFRAAEMPEHFNVDLQGRRLQSKERFERWKQWYRTHRRRRRQLRRAVTQSHLRSATAQASIWYQKFMLDDSHFNRVTVEAARKCGLRAGVSWKSELERHRRCWFETLDGPARERQILTASSAPGISRHHWGTEIDLFGLNPYHFREDRVYAEEYDWLSQHALDFGFFQTYHRDKPDPDRPGYIAEPWHWSYYPIAQALTSFASEHEDEFDERLNDMWDRLERRFNTIGSKDYHYFQYVRHHWRAFVFNITVPEFEASGAEREDDT